MTIRLKHIVRIVGVSCMLCSFASSYALSGSDWLAANPDAFRIESNGGDISINISALDGIRWCVDASDDKWIQPSYICGEGAKKIRFKIGQSSDKSRGTNLVLRTISYPYYETYIRIRQGKEDPKLTIANVDIKEK